MSSTLLWVRRDLRLRDQPALLVAARAGEVLPVFVVDPALSRRRLPRTERLSASLAALHRATGGALVIRTGHPAQVLPSVAKEAGAAEVHVTGETTPYGRRRDDGVARALADAGRRLVPTGTPYAVDPGTLLTGAGTPYQVFTPFHRAWRDQVRPPAPAPDAVRWLRDVPSESLPDAPRDADAGEEAALARWQDFLREGLPGYAERRDRPDLDGTSRLSAALKYGELHPRTLLADLARSEADEADVGRFVAELGWREFYADVLWHHPGSAWHDLHDDLRGLAYDDPDGSDDVRALVEAWRTGRTGYPFVDAGMRQLLAEGWMHNRVRMVTASFLTKDLHLWWPVGARHFLDLLRDGDLASNNHGWQWVAGTGTDPAPYFRILNPIAQGKRFDPDGDYVRRWVPELRHLSGVEAHEPWSYAEGYLYGYPERVVDHVSERKEALARYEARRGAGT